MRIILLAILLITLHTASFAQMETTVIGGINRATQIEKGGRQSSDISIDYIPGFNIGVAVADQISDQFYVDLAFLFEQKGADREEVISLASSTITNTNNARLYYATIPFRAQYRFSLSKENFLFVGAGLYGSMGLFGRGNYTTKTKDDEYRNSYKVDWWSSDPKRNNEFRNLDLGFTTQIGLKIKRIRIELNYDRGIRNISSVPTREYKRFNQTFRMSFGYEFEL